jgi:hypothetical protein
MAVTQFTGTTITFSSSFFQGAVVEMNWSGIERTPLETTNANQVNEGTPIYGKQFTPSVLYDPGEVEIRLLFDETMNPPITGAAETVTVTFPGSSFWSATGFMTRFEITGQLDGLWEARSTLKLSANVTF